MMTLRTTTTRPWPKRPGLDKVTRTQRTKPHDRSSIARRGREPGQGTEGAEVRRWVVVCSLPDESCARVRACPPTPSLPTPGGSAPRSCQPGQVRRARAGGKRSEFIQVCRRWCRCRLCCVPCLLARTHRAARFPGPSRTPFYCGCDARGWCSAAEGSEGAIIRRTARAVLHCYVFEFPVPSGHPVLSFFPFVSP